MTGGGFLRQMMETMKYNRDLLRKKKHKPFDRSAFVGKFSVNEGLVDTRQLSAEDRRILLQRNRKRKKQDNIKSIVVLTLSIALTLAILWVLINWVFKYLSNR